MEQGHAKAILAFERPTPKAEVSADRRWKWQSGVILFPEALCHFCNQPIRSNRIWLVDRRAMRLDGRLKLVSGKLVREPVVDKAGRSLHPHISPVDYHICMGDCDKVEQALFLGIKQGSPFWPPGADWYADVFDHKCGEKLDWTQRNALGRALGEPAVQGPTVAAMPTVTTVTLTATASPRPAPAEPPLFNGRGADLTLPTGGLSLERLERADEDLSF